MAGAIAEIVEPRGAVEVFVAADGGIVGWFLPERNIGVREDSPNG